MTLEDKIAGRVPPSVIPRSLDPKEKVSRMKQYRNYQRLKNHYNTHRPNELVEDVIDDKPDHSFQVRKKERLQKPQKYKIKVPKVLEQVVRARPNSTGQSRRLSSGTVPRAKRTLRPKTVDVGIDPVDGIGVKIDDNPIPKQESEKKLEISTKVIRKPTPSERIGVLYSPSTEHLSPVKLKENGVSKWTSSPISKSPGDSSQPLKFTDDMTLDLWLNQEFSDEEKARISSGLNVEPEKKKFLPLELFDDGIFEQKTPEEWIASCSLAKSLYYDLKHERYIWRPCKVLSYDATKELFTIEWIPQEEDKNSAQSQPKQKKVFRLNLCFDEENQMKFFERLNKAKARRYQAERRIRYLLQVGEMDDDKVVPLEPEVIDRSLKLVASEFPLYYIETIKGCIQEVHNDHKQSLKKSIFDYFRKDPKVQKKLLELDIQDEEVPKPAPDCGTVPISPYDFENHRNLLSQESFLTKDVLLDTLSGCHNQFDEYSHLRALDTKFQHPCTLLHFLSVQADALHNFLRFVKKDWKAKVIQTVQLNITEDIFNFYAVDEMYKYENSRMKRVVRLINLMLSEQLRSLMEKSVSEFVSFLEKFKANPDEPLDVHNVNGNQPLFEIRIVSDGVSAQFEPSLEELYSGVDEVFKNMYDSQHIPRITSALFPILNLPHLELSSLQADEEFSEKMWQACANILIENREKPLKLLQLFKQYEELLEMDDDYYKIFRERNTVKPPTPEDEKKKKEKVNIDDETEEHEETKFDHESEEEDSESSEEEEVPAARASTPKFQIKKASDNVEVIEQPLDPHIAGSPTLTQYRDELKRLKSLSEEVTTISSDEISFELIRISTTPIQESLIQQSKIGRSSILQYINDLSRETNQEISYQYEEIYARLQEHPNNAEELQELINYVADVRETINGLLEQFYKVQECMKTLNEFDFSVPPEDFTLYMETFSWPNKILSLLVEMKAQIELEKAQFQDMLINDVQTLNEDMTSYSKDMEEFKNFSDLEKVEKYHAIVQEMNEKIEKCSSLSKLYNSREKIFKLPLSDFKLLDDLQQDFKPWKELWTIVYQQSQQYPEWVEGQFVALNPEVVEENTLNWIKHLNKLERLIVDDGPHQIAISVREKLTDFKQHIPLIKALRTKGLKLRHWTKIGKFVSEDVNLHENLENWKFQDFLDMKLNEHYMEVQEIADYATKEYAIDLNLEKMQSEWKKVAFELENHSTSYKIVEVDEIQILLDEQIVLTQSMRASPYVKEVENDVIAWEKKLLDIQDIMDEWLKCQVGWMYLEPIFSSDDIATQLPKEKVKFTAVDQLWHRVMEKCNKSNGIVMQVVTINNLHSDFLRANKRLDEIQKSLKDYLETKRQAFSRLYFLSDDELLQILSETKDPLRVQPHLKKCFEGINELQFETINDILTITAMKSRDGETIKFLSHVAPSEFSGNVELWLFKVQEEMKASIRNEVINAMKTYSEMKRTDWIASTPGQIALGVGQLFWTKEVEEAILDMGTRGVQKYYLKLQKQIEDIVMRVRGNLSKSQRTVFGAVTTIDVHSKDVVHNLVKEEVDDIDHFEWKSQLRYYWEETDNQFDMNVKQVTAVRKYGYEYLGNSGRLVITPLTDRCYRTLMGALQLSLGGAPEGPAGTGKTETVKDLAKAVANQCVVFNCSDSLDTVAMEKFFKGLASSGAWSCFDEFNRIEMEVLSVVAQQILSIQLAVRARKERFFFEGVEIDLDCGCAVFITMNPGYAGRSELPDNLKALFRPVAMMVPDYALIAEIVLFSYGFVEGRDLSTKIVATYQLCSEQLSSQSHYDYGMRAVKAVLDRAGSLKREFPEEQEARLMLRAITDVNLPKFLSPDIPLFEGIIKDLFPGVNVEDSDKKELISSMLAVCTKRKLQPKKEFFDKIIQLYEMIIVRHGLMIVGDPFAGKTESYRVLSQALTMMSKKGLEDKVEVCVVAPKSITMGQLYGSTDPQTNEWKDGILAIHFRRLSSMDATTRRWMLFDGPVDALWIESMNTVLDDNRKLCLPSGMIIKMGENMNMIFEVADLAVASPATVSRCGMVYMEPEKLGWRPLFDSYIQFQLPKPLRKDENIVELLNVLTDWFIDPLLDFVERECREFNRTSKFTRYRSFLDIFDSLLDIFRSKDAKSMKTKDKVKVIEGIFLFSCIWSLCSTVTLESRKKCSTFFRQVVDFKHSDNATEIPHKFTEPFPEKDSIYDFFFDQDKAKWTSWGLLVKKADIPDDALFSEIIVPTIDTTRYTYLLDHLVQHNRRVLFVGPTGTGKTAYIKAYMFNELDPQTYKLAFVNFSATTSANETQDITESKLQKRKKGTIGAPVGRKMILFVDDLNLPTLEEYGAQPPVELYRQMLGHGGWYDRSSKEGAFTNIVDVRMISAMGPPGGGRNPVTPRFTRFFNTIGLTEFGDETLVNIFTEIVDWWLKGTSFMTQGKNIVQSSVLMYRKVMKHFRPRPDKSHYTFNLRDLSKVFQGVLQMKASSIEEPTLITRLWSHECMRVFKDRLINDTDREQFDAILETLLKTKFKCSLKDIIPNGVSIFANYMDANEDFRVYEEIPDMNTASKRLNEYLEEHNVNPKNNMELILFKFAIEHCSRISRIITQPYGNALLIGVGGSGRQSLTKLATFAASYDLFQIHLTKKYSIKDWKDDMRSLLIGAGQKGKSTVFLFTDSQIKDQSFIEDINNLLNTGEIPNLFNPDEKKDICEGLRKIARENGRDLSSAGLFNYFVERCRKFLHIVICMSPIGDNLRNYLRMFPSLVNCCTIDWFSEWPAEALQSVGESSLEEIGLQEELIQPCVSMAVVFHKSIEQLSKKYLDEQKRYNYVTPTSYLELLQTIKRLYNKKTTEIKTLKRKYGNGINSIVETEQLVSNMQKELEVMKPKLVKLTEENEALSKTIFEETEQVEATRKIVEVEEQKISVQNAENEKIKAECEEKLAQAMPALKKANKALEALQKSHITEVKSMPKPPTGVRMVMKTVCIIKKVAPVWVDQGMGKKTQDYWTPAKKMMGQSGFLDSLINFNIDSLTDSIVDKLKPIITQSDYNEKGIKKVNVAAAGLCSWVLSLVKVHEIMKVVRPRQAALKKALADAELTAKQLKETKDKMQILQDKLDKLEADRQSCVDEKRKLEDEFQMVTLKLERAQKLIGLLSGEKDRWTTTLKGLETKILNLTGDVLLSAGFMSYLGAFTQSYRQEAVEEWKTKLKEHNIAFSDDYSLSGTIGKQEAVREWLVQGLPSDDFSIDNAVVTANASRWPLFIDPQYQAMGWIKNMEKDKEQGCISIKATDSNLVRSLEKAIQLGATVILEKVGEELDPALNPLLLKQIFKIGGMLSISIGDNPITYNDNFKLYLLSDLSNPHYLPEVSTKVSILNFMITPKGLDDQLLGLVVRAEKEELEKKKQELAADSVQNKNQLSKIEDDILTLLDETEDILADDVAVNMLSNAKSTANNVKLQQEQADRILATIEKTRESYKPVAHMASALFFVVAEMGNVDPMYQFSLQWYNELYLDVIEQSPKDTKDRIQTLIDYFKYDLFCKVTRSFFEKDKMLFSLLMCVALMNMEGKIDPQEWRFLLTGGLMVDATAFKNPTDWLSEQSFSELINLHKVESMKSFYEDFCKKHNQWKESVYESKNPKLAVFPEPWTNATPMQRLIILRILRLDSVSEACELFIKDFMDERYVNPPRFNIETSYSYANCERPLVFILSAGVDPMATLQAFALKELGEGNVPDTMSLGQGQGKYAKEKIQKAVVRGNWVVLQNCHLCPSWMPELEKIVDTFEKGKTADTFRLWLTSMPSPIFPVNILRNSVKIVQEAPRGLKANLGSSWNSDPITDPAFFDGCNKPTEFKKLLFGLCFFHAIIQERRKYGPIGWNIPYEYNESDLNISIRQLKFFLDQHEYIPFRTLVYLTGECNYGGRVTDDHDRTTLLAILKDFYVEDILTDVYRFDDEGIYYSPSEGNHEHYNEYINELPAITTPSVFGLHENANITKNQNEARILFEYALLTQSRSGSGGGKTMEEIVGEQAKDILSKMPEEYDIEEASKKYPVEYKESMNTVLVQELLRFNQLIRVIKKTLVEVQKALVGEVVMSLELEKLANAIYDSKIPEKWKANSYPSLKPLGGYILDLLKRIEFFNDWLQNGNPTVFWLSGFYFTQSFLTGTKQNFARKHVIAIDTITWEFEILDHRPIDKPEDGAYVDGLFLEGARWDEQLRCLVDPEPKKLFQSMPVIWMKPTTKLNNYDHYSCPLYKTADRRGTLSTTGHSTNFVCMLRIPRSPEKDANFWVKRGVALLCSPP